MKGFFRRVALVTTMFGACLILSNCGGKSVAGNTYEGAGGGVTVEFQSGGKAVTSIAGVKADCTYTEDDKTVALTCEGQPVVLTINEDGSLNGPPDGMLGKLTKKQ